MARTLGYPSGSAGPNPVDRVGFLAPRRDAAPASTEVASTRCCQPQWRGGQGYAGIVPVVLSFEAEGQSGRSGTMHAAGRYIDLACAGLRYFGGFLHRLAD